MNKRPEPPFPPQPISPPGLEARMDPKPRYEAPTYKAANKLAGPAGGNRPGLRVLRQQR